MLLEEENFDEPNGLLGMYRDLYLSVTQFLNTSLLRKYIGLCEETFLRINHIHFTLYRLKFDRTPLFRLTVPNKEYKLYYFGRTVMIGNDLDEIILKEPILNKIFQLKLTFAKRINVVQIANPIDTFLNDGCGLYIESGRMYFTYKYHTKKGEPTSIPNSCKHSERNELTGFINKNY
jgi:hypothetical protein